MALIISNRLDNGKCPNPILDERTCAKDEECLLYKTWHRMDLAVKTETNLSAQEMTECLNGTCGLVLEDDRTFVCCILSHGGRDDSRHDFIYGNDGGNFYLYREAYENNDQISVVINFASIQRPVFQCG